MSCSGINNRARYLPIDRPAECGKYLVYTITCVNISCLFLMHLTKFSLCCRHQSTVPKVSGLIPTVIFPDYSSFFIQIASLERTYFRMVLVLSFGSQWLAIHYNRQAQMELCNVYVYIHFFLCFNLERSRPILKRFNDQLIYKCQFYILSFVLRLGFAIEYPCGYYNLALTVKKEQILIDSILLHKNQYMVNIHSREQFDVSMGHTNPVIFTFLYPYK